MSDAISELLRAVRDFSAARQWQPFHSPKNLSMALNVEAAELLEHFQWLTAEESDNLPAETLRKVQNEMSDVLLYLLLLADRLDVNLVAAAKQKLMINADKYPVEKSRGNARKYDQLDEPRT
ncbi:MAG: MazG-like family protein [Oceanococcaceae bacterium]